MNTTKSSGRSLQGRRLLAGLLFGAWVGAMQAQTSPDPAPSTSPEAAAQTSAESKMDGKVDGPGTVTTPGLVLSADGAYVLDVQNKLAWLRCVEGMTWNGHNCVGEPRLMTFTTAQALAGARAKAEGVAWRLPRIHELRRIKEDAASATLFPADPQGWTWSGNASISVAQTNPYNYDNIANGSTNQQERLSARMGWAVHLGNGESRGDVSRRTALVVRLVRPYQP
ncbi:DUF1566 domain-containing protein [Hylemonella gracilis]|nr:DUF1566 domain-containing protein [Hylemonella gracilis]